MSSFLLKSFIFQNEGISKYEEISKHEEIFKKYLTKNENSQIV